MHFLEKWLDARSILVFSETCHAALSLSSDYRKKRNLKCLLTAVVYGNEDLARNIVASYPKLLLDSSIIVTDISGKVIKNLTPLQAAICAGDVDMVQTITEILHQNHLNLSFEPELEIQRQFSIIYPNGDIASVETAQKAKAQEFNNSNLNYIYTAINTATEVQVISELENPGTQNTDSELNAALRNFREQFSATSNLEQTFNPFYLLTALELYDKKFDDFNGDEHSDDKWNRRNLFWRQVIGYIQRHLPACYLQAFTQGICIISEKKENLKRDFKFAHDKDYVRPIVEDFNNLGYKYGVPVIGGWRAERVNARSGRRSTIACIAFKNYCEQKNQACRAYAQSGRQRLPSLPATCCVIV